MAGSGVSRRAAGCAAARNPRFFCYLYLSVTRHDMHLARWNGEMGACEALGIVRFREKFRTGDPWTEAA